MRSTSRARKEWNASFVEFYGESWVQTLAVHRFMENGKVLVFGICWALTTYRRQFLVRNFTGGWLRWYVEEANCFWWERFWRMIVQSSYFAAFIWFKLLHTTFFRQTFLFGQRHYVFPNRDYLSVFAVLVQKITKYCFFRISGPQIYITCGDCSRIPFSSAGNTDRAFFSINQK